MSPTTGYASRYAEELYSNTMLTVTAWQQGTGSTKLLSLVQSSACIC